MYSPFVSLFSSLMSSIQQKNDDNGENSDTNGESSRMSVYGTWLISDCAVEHGLGSTYTLT